MFLFYLNVVEVVLLFLIKICYSFDLQNYQFNSHTYIRPVKFVEKYLWPFTAYNIAISGHVIELLYKVK